MTTMSLGFDWCVVCFVRIALVVFNSFVFFKLLTAIVGKTCSYCY